MTVKNTYEKVSFNLPTNLKKEVSKLKDELKVSLNSIYKTAIEEYVEKQELAKWEKGAKLASKNKKYLALCDELGETGGELYEY
ncbi:hypothetical protein [Sulfurimonas indica]|uniref:hypothetical protein n=1 Tax=Sulfurimonas indica TaxID=2508707 RepID=UPI001264527B|nr:hypothetical protein [Sulfurimonas indica]